ncbi:dephospho-CoA kinase [Legionella saoudiensis]|uniref:dephospho-CoA kinase n=1 Tax=Legionella saoudiensis TaxID=1750561 RepID=UPI00073099DD|nr:dephospho-CoA kinase [Legionella saoudiensis]
MVYCVGLTGGIASGKSTAATIFAQLGMQVINADNIARALTLRGEDAYTQIVAHYGSEILNKDNELNRKALRAIIFSNPLERAWLEQLLHPLIRQKIKEQVHLSTSPYCIVEIPLLIDKKAYPYINRVLLIQAPKQVQIERLMQRDNCTQEQALSILAAQPDANLRLKNADDIIINDAGTEKLKSEIIALHHKYLQQV